MSRIKYKVVHKLEPVNAAYIAGLVDGEGTITLVVKQKNAQRHLALTISNTEFDLLKNVLRVVGAGKLTSKVAYSTKHAIGYTYAIYNQQALTLLSQINPYLRSYKKKRAKLILSRYLVLTPRNGKYNKTMLKKRAEFIEKFFSIKAKTSLSI
jgi:hypothetical protein